MRFRRAVAIVLSAAAVLAAPACRAGGVPVMQPPPAMHAPPPRLDLGELQMQRFLLWQHLHRIERRQWALEACRKQHPPKSKARRECLERARKLPRG